MTASLHYYENTGSRSQPGFTERIGAANPLAGIDVSNRSNPTFADLDNDGDLDLVVGEHGYLNYYEDTSSRSQSDFTERTGTANPLENVEWYSHSVPSFADLDNDGDLDLVVGEYEGILNYYENTGSRSQPDFTERTGVDNPLDGIDVDYNSAPTFADLDGDGDLDLVVGEWYGALHYYENTGSRSQPNFTERTGAANPLAGIDVGGNASTPTFADLDGDGDLDLILGEREGHLYYYENTGTRTEASFTPHSLVGQVALTLYDNGGNDTLDLRTDTADQRVDLRPEGISDVYGLVGNLVIARGTVIEHFIAGSGNDTVIGNTTANRLEGRAGNDLLRGSAGNDILIGGPGADRLVGNSGHDTAAYTHSPTGVTVRLHSLSASGGDATGDTFPYQIDVAWTDSDGVEQTESLPDIENLSGSAHNDVLAGDRRDNVIDGGAGHDTLYGGPGVGNDSLWGSGGNDVLEGGAGADRLSGGTGVDTVSYQESDAGVAVKLREGTGKRGHAEGDVIAEVENVIGSDHNDTLVGDSLDNLLTGNAGNDFLWGSAGNDLLIGGPGADRLVGNSGHDTAAYTHSPTGVTVRLHNLSATGGDATGDTFPYRVDVAWTDIDGVEQTESLPDVEHLSGSAHDDVLAGDRRDNVIDGGAGHDTLYGGPGGGDDRLDGGPGDDRLYGGQGRDRLAGAAGDDRLVGGPGADVFVVGPGEGEDIVTDFTDGEDRIDLTAFGLAGIDAITTTTVALDLTDSGGGTILLADFAMATWMRDFIV